MKKVLLFIAVLCLQATALFAQTPQKIGFVDSEVMFKALPEAIKAKGDLEELTNKYYSQADSMTAQLKQMYDDFQKQANTMKPDKQKEMQQTFVQKQQELEQFKQQKFGQNGDLVKKQDELFKPVKEKILKGIQDVSKDESLSFVFDKVGDAYLLYADSAFDITYKVLDKLKRGK